MIELRSEMNGTAILKAEQANERRFDSVNEFRETLTDQARNFVTVGVLDARTMQLQNQSDVNERATRALADTASARMASMDSQIASLNGKVIVGGSSIAIVLLVAQLVINFAGPFHSITPPVPTVVTSAVADNTKRVDDLIARLDALQRSSPPR